MTCRWRQNICFAASLITFRLCTGHTRKKHDPQIQGHSWVSQNRLLDLTVFFYLYIDFTLLALFVFVLCAVPCFLVVWNWFELVRAFLCSLCKTSALTLQQQTLPLQALLQGPSIPRVPGGSCVIITVEGHLYEQIITSDVSTCTLTHNKGTTCSFLWNKKQCLLFFDFTEKHAANNSRATNFPTSKWR